MDILYRYSIFYTGMNVATLDQDSGLQQKLFIVVDLTTCYVLRSLREKSRYPLPEPQGVEENDVEEDAEGELEEPEERLREETRGGEGRRYRRYPLPEPQGVEKKGVEKDTRGRAGGTCREAERRDQRWRRASVSSVSSP
jgi:hypothetical protein